MLQVTLSFRDVDADKPNQIEMSMTVTFDTTKNQTTDTFQLIKM
jgi:hypothetical protein